MASDSIFKYEMVCKVHDAQTSNASERLSLEVRNQESSTKTDEFHLFNPPGCLLTDFRKNSRLTRTHFQSYWFGPTRLARLHRDALQIMGGVLIARHKRPRRCIYLWHSNAKELLFVKGSSPISLNTGGCRRMNGEELKGEVSTAISGETAAAVFRSLSPLDWCLAIYKLLRATIHLAQ